ARAGDSYRAFQCNLPLKRARCPQMRSVSARRRRLLPALHALYDSDQVAFGILELAELDHVHDRLRTHDPRPAEALRLRECFLDVVDRDVEGHVSLVS